MLFSEREPSSSKYKYKRFGDETVKLYNCRSLSDCSFVRVTHAQLLFSSVFGTFARLSPRAALLVYIKLGKSLIGISWRRFLYRDLISQRQYHTIPQQWFERPETSKNTSFAEKFVKDGVMNERSRKISVKSWRCGAREFEFGIQHV